MDKGASGVSVGLTTIIVTLTVIAMTIFAVLAASTAKREAALAEKYAQSVTDYWAADCRCVDMANAVSALGLDDGFAQKVSALGASAVPDGDGWLVQWITPAGEKTAIAVTLRVSPGGTETLRWQQVSTDEDWQPVEIIPVYTGKEDNHDIS